MKILIISPAYAPFSGVGAVRMISLSCFLRNQGEDVTVMRNLPELWPKNMLQSVVPQGIHIIDVNASGQIYACAKAYQLALDKLLTVEKFDIALFSCGPFYTIMAAPYIKSKYHLDYILEFRDLWVHEDIPCRGILRDIKWKIVSSFYKPIERRGVVSAAKIIVVTDGDKKVMTKHYKKRAGDIETIFNGYDDERLKNLLSVTVSIDPIYIGIFGKLAYYNSELTEELFLGIKVLAEKGYNVKILHIGPVEEDVDNIMQKVGFPMGHYECTGSRDYLDGMRLLQKVRICTLIHTHSTGLGTKTFDYIYLNKPILSLSNANLDLSKLINAFENGYVCQNREHVVEVIENIIQKNIFQLTPGDKGKQFARSIQNQCYYGLIKGLSEKR